MNTLDFFICSYLEYCKNQKRLDAKTLKAYRIDLHQFLNYTFTSGITEISSDALEKYIGDLHKKYQPKTAKRKIASIKAFYNHLEYKKIIYSNPFNGLHIAFREPTMLPKIIPLNIIETILSEIYNQYSNAKSEYKRKTAVRNAAVIELLFATGMRISELCSLKKYDIDLFEGTILIHGKGKRDRRIQICNKSVLKILNEFKCEYQLISNCHENFFINQNGTPLSDQAVRRMIKKYTSLANINLRITPHMFRHTFATSLLENDVDIRYIQKMLGHSSINITEIYTHVTISKQTDILRTKHPRNNFKL